MTRVVDARGLSCPQPVILARKSVQGDELPVELLLDTDTAVENVRRAMEQLGLTIQVQEAESDFKVIISK